MANTTNYNWETPDETDLVKDGAAAIRTLGNSIDTTTKNLNPETTTGDIAYRSATANTNTRLAIGTTGQVLTVAAGVPSWATPTDQTPLTTKGDLFTFSTVDARLGVGANGTVLTADSAEATGLKWATSASGGETLISTTTLSGSSVLLDNIPATYNDLKLIVRDYLPASDNYSLRLRFNDDANANRHRTGTDLALGGAFNATSVNISAGNDNAVSESLIWAYIYDYTNTTTWKMNDSLSIITDATTTANFQIWRQWGVYNQTGAISSLRLFPDSGNFTSGTALLYGVK